MVGIWHSAANQVLDGGAVLKKVVPIYCRCTKVLFHVFASIFAKVSTFEFNTHPAEKLYFVLIDWG